ncbi:MAG: hypothetical protein ACRER2_05000 [Methylococcales bacterium]
MSADDTRKKTSEPPINNWKRFDEGTEERHAAALKDPEAATLPNRSMARMKRTAQV